MAGTLNLTLAQGSTWSVTLTYKDANGAAINLSGYTAAMQVRASHAASTTVLSLTSGSGITLGGAAGTITITASAATTAAIEAGTYVYDLELTTGSTVTRLVEGSVTVTPEVTR